MLNLSQMPAIPLPHKGLPAAPSQLACKRRKWGMGGGCQQCPDVLMSLLLNPEVTSAYHWGKPEIVWQLDKTLILSKGQNIHLRCAVTFECMGNDISMPPATGRPTSHIHTLLQVARLCLAAPSQIVWNFTCYFQIAHCLPSLKGL